MTAARGPGPGPGVWRQALARTAVVGGLVLLGIAAAMLWRQQTAAPAYRYVVGEALPAAAGALRKTDGSALSVRQVKLVAGDEATPLAELQIAESAQGPVLVDWRARVDDPFLTLGSSPGEVAALAAVLARHVPPDATLLAWWDHSRLLKLLASVDTAFDRHLGIPLFVPERWRGQRTAVEAAEQAFWLPRGSKADAGLASEKARFERFAQALLAPEAQGIAALQALAGGKTAVLVLHLRDVVLLGQMAPQKIGVAFQDFGTMGDVHGMVRRVHTWLDSHKYPAYGVLQEHDRPLRAIALTDAASGRTLAARLLPFMGNEQRDVAGATLVYRVGGFSVFEIAPAGAATVPQAPAQ